jgi:hypothetical protein
MKKFLLITCFTLTIIVFGSISQVFAQTSGRNTPGVMTPRQNTPLAPTTPDGNTVPFQTGNTVPRSPNLPTVPTLGSQSTVQNPVQVGTGGTGSTAGTNGVTTSGVLDTTNFGNFVKSAVDILRNGLIPVLFSLAVVILVKNALDYAAYTDSNERKKMQWKLIRSFIGLVVLLSFWGILAILSNTLGLQDVGIPQLWTD